MAVIVMCANCPHGRGWHEKRTGRCRWHKQRNSGGPTTKGMCECTKFRAGEEREYPKKKPES